MGELHTSPDPLAVALVFATAADPSELVLWLQRRRQALAVELATLGAERVRLEGHGHLRSLQAAVMRRAEAAMAADIAWHDELNQTLNASGPGGPAVIAGGAQM
jgi:Virulence activator alpha C-term